MPQPDHERSAGDEKAAAKKASVLDASSRASLARSRTADAVLAGLA